MWREAVYREREAVDKERETVKAILKREQEARDKERTAKWAAIKRELQVVHQHREECQKREAAEQRVKRLQRMLGDANTQLLAAANRLSMRGILGTTLSSRLHNSAPCSISPGYLAVLPAVPSVRSKPKTCQISDHLCVWAYRLHCESELGCVYVGCS